MRKFRLLIVLFFASIDIHSMPFMHGTQRFLTTIVDVTLRGDARLVVVRRIARVLLNTSACGEIDVADGRYPQHCPIGMRIFSLPEIRLHYQDACFGHGVYYAALGERPRLVRDTIQCCIQETLPWS